MKLRALACLSAAVLRGTCLIRRRTTHQVRHLRPCPAMPLRHAPLGVPPVLPAPVWRTAAILSWLFCLAMASAAAAATSVGGIMSSTSRVGAQGCQRADWMNDEPLMKPRDADCRVVRNGKGGADNICVPS